MPIQSINRSIAHTNTRTNARTNVHTNAHTINQSIKRPYNRSIKRPYDRLCRCLPFVSAVASLCSSAVVARAPLVIYPLKTRHHDATTTPQPTIPLQPVCYHAADDHRNPYLYHNQSAAITLQTTTATPTFTTTSLLLSRCRRLSQPLPLPQPVCYHAADDHCNPYLYYNQSAAIKLRTTTATSLQLSRCRRLPQPLPLPQPVCSYSAADNHYTMGAQQGCRRRTAGVPRAHRRRTADADTQYHNTINTTNTTIPQYQFTADVPQA